MQSEAAKLMENLVMPIPIELENHIDQEKTENFHSALHSVAPKINA